MTYWLGPRPSGDRVVRECVSGLGVVAVWDSSGKMSGISRVGTSRPGFVEGRNAYLRGADEVLLPESDVSCSFAVSKHQRRTANGENIANNGRDGRMGAAVTAVWLFVT